MEVIRLNAHLFVSLVAILILFFLLIVVLSFFNDFYRELHYLNIEIRRTVGTERKYWIRKRRKLWLSVLPFVKY